VLGNIGEGMSGSDSVSPHKLFLFLFPRLYRRAAARARNSVTGIATGL